MVGHAWADKPTTHMVDRLERSLAELRSLKPSIRQRHGTDLLRMEKSASYGPHTNPRGARRAPGGWSVRVITVYLEKAATMKFSALNARTLGFLNARALGFLEPFALIGCL